MLTSDRVYHSQQHYVTTLSLRAFRRIAPIGALNRRRVLKQKKVHHDMCELRSSAPRMNERRQRRHSATTLHVALLTVTESERRMVPHTSLYPAIGRVRAKECNRLDIMIGSPQLLTHADVNAKCTVDIYA